MPCYKPLKAWKTPSGEITFNTHQSYGPSMQLPCGRCVGCKIQRSKEWALRCSHEIQMMNENKNQQGKPDPLPSTYITLTYNDDHLPPDASLDRRKPNDFQIFIRSLRQHTQQKMRYFMCGEYGEATEKNKYIARPHYHAIIFGYDFPDKKPWKVRNGNQTYLSNICKDVWGKGHIEIGSATYQSAAYVARYIIKKQFGAYKNDNPIIDNKTGEIIGQRKPEYTNMSLKPGIGETWYRKYGHTDVFPNDYVIDQKGREVQTPKYYRVLLEREHPALHEILKEHRVEKAKSNKDNTPKRLKTREFVQNSKLKRLPRHKEL